MKKLFSAFMTLCVALNLLTICPMTAFAASEDLTLSVDSAEAIQGDTATISISVPNNPGVSYLKLKVAYDSSAVAVDSVSNKNLIDGAAFQQSKTKDTNPYVLVWSAAENSLNTGELATITFKALDNASAGTYPITVTVDECSNETFEDVSTSVTDGSVAVKEDAVTSLAESSTTTTEGVEPELPGTVKATYESGRTGDVNVTWDSISASQYAAEGSFTVNGTVNGTSIKAVCNVTVNKAPATIVSLEKVEVSTAAGVAPAFPGTVKANYSDGTSQTLSVSWNKVEGDYSTEGNTFEVKGTVAGTDLEAVCSVKVTAPEIVSAKSTSVTTKAGIAPVLPETVTVEYTNGTTKTVAVTWNNIDASSYENTGTFDVSGKIAGTSVSAKCTVTVIEAGIESVDNTTANTPAGLEPELPKTVTATLENGKTAQVAVVWNDVDKSQYENVGDVFEVEGSVDAFDGKVICTVTVTAPVITSYSNPKYTMAAGYIPVLNDSINAILSDGTQKTVKVEWLDLGRDKFMNVGDVVEVKGVALDEAGIQIPNLGNSAVPTAYITLTNPLIISANNAEVETVVGNAPELPETVTVNLSNDTKAQVNVSWSDIDASSYAQVGEFTVSGVVLESESIYQFSEDFSLNGGKTELLVKVVEKATEPVDNSTTTPSNNANNSTDTNKNTNNSTTVENVKTGEADYATTWIAFVFSIIAMCSVIVTKKYHKSESENF